MPLIGRGWSEPEKTHIWSLGDLSELWLKLAPTAARLRLLVSGNPHVSGGDQRLEIRVNGQAVGEASIDHGGRSTIEVNCGHEAWLAGAINRIVLHPSAVAVPPAVTNDTRLLGFCLWQLDVD